MASWPKGLRAPPPRGADDDDGDAGDGEDEDGFVEVDVARELERLKWFLWHGNIFRALETIEDLAEDLWREHPEPERVKLLKAVAELDGYIRANASSIPSYAERHLAGEPISSAFVEATVNQVISKRMVKKQAMRWTPQGAHPSSPGPDEGAERSAGRRLPPVVPVVRARPGTDEVAA